ncbi:retinal maintenance-domain-containing protein [Haematococcus lacustris]
MTDLDDLLRELDDLPAPSQSLQNRNVHSTPLQTNQPDTIARKPMRCSVTPTSLQKQGTRRSSIDQLLDDLDIHSPSSSLLATQRSPAPTTTALAGSSSLSRTSSSQVHKCMGVHLGGADLPRGRNGAAVGSIQCCDALRCTKCDFSVISFPQRAWHADVDYLFLRNNYPTSAKLSPLLVSEAGSCAYCCQCSWRAVATGEVARIDPYASELRWVCAGHGS